MIWFRWIWVKHSDTFLLIFIFDPDSSKPNLRFDEVGLITWAPSHVEQGRISELLSLANRLNGLPKEARKNLRGYFYIFDTENERYSSVLFPLSDECIKETEKAMHEALTKPILWVKGLIKSNSSLALQIIPEDAFETNLVRRKINEAFIGKLKLGKLRYD